MISMYSHLLNSIASTIADYRQGEIAPITPAHVARWIDQFDPSVRLPMLQELDHVLKRTYFSKVRVLQWLGMLVAAKNFVGAAPQTFWSTVSVLRLPSRGGSQADITALIEASVKARFGVSVGATASPSGPFIYLDDFIFTGNTAIAELSRWITLSAPQQIALHIVVIGVHTYGEYYVQRELNKAATQAGKSLSLSIWRSGEFEDRRSCVNNAEVFRPTSASGDPDVDAYVAQLTAANHPPTLRSPGSMPTTGAFFSVATRDVLEWELLRVGARLRAQCVNPKRVMRPLGFSTLDTLGFGATVVTFRNCPNNVPLALWWGDPNATSGALAWYPLLPRRQPGSVQQWRPLFAPPSTTAHRPWLTPSNRSHELLEDDAMPWEREANAAVERAVESLEFDTDEGVVRAEVDEGWTVIESLDELRSHLEAVYDESWYARVPFEGGEAVFDGDSSNVVEDALAGLASELESLGWDL